MQKLAKLAIALALTLNSFAFAAPAGSAPNPPALFSPPDGSTLASFGTNLTWSNQPGTTQLHIQIIPTNNDGPGVNLLLNPVSNFAVPEPPIWYGLLPDMTYTWRVRTATAPGAASESDYTAWASRTFRTPKVSSGSISALSPGIGAIVSTLTPTLQWSNSRSDVFYYELQLTKDGTFDTDPATATAMVYGALIHGGASTPPNSYTVPSDFPLESGVKYYWRVRPRVQGDGAQVDWPQPSSFQILATSAATPTPIPVPAPSPTPTPAPSGGEVDGGSTGYRIAFASNKDSGKEDNWEVYVMNADGTNETRVTNNVAQDRWPTWSPDGRRIAFESNRDGNDEIYVSNINGRLV
ncbi:MAG: hypothetical protein EXR50_04630 [Dehalococcoidia bacterium]|nr:hypothetical protein [Dehalococcoidia bacterium]